MIRINLLPVKQAQKRSLGQQQLIFAVIIIVILVGVLYTMNKAEEDKIAGLEEQKKTLTSELTKLDDLIGDAEKVKVRENELKKKLDVIQELKASKTGPVRMLDELSGLIPRKLWITSFNLGGDNISLRGVAVTNKDIAVFMRNLESSPFFSSIHLKDVKAKTAKSIHKLADVEFLSEFQIRFKYQKPGS